MEVQEEARKIADLIISMPSDIQTMMKSIEQLVSKSDKVPEKPVIEQQIEIITKSTEINPRLAEFQTHLYSQWESFRNKQPLKEIRSFANRIREIGEDSHIDFLFEYGNAVIASINEFNIEALRERLARFPSIINKLKKMGNESN